MPTTVNGIGTHYYGKRHLRKELGVCDNCHEQHQLENYETTLFIVILYIPIIPLGRKQIVDCCPSCTFHRAVSVQEWQKLKSAALEQTLTSLAGSMDDPRKAMEHLVTLSGFNEMDEARELAATIKNQFIDHAEVQFGLGAWYERMGNASQATQCFERAFQLNPDDPAIRRAQVLTYIEQGRLAEARELLRALEPPTESFDPIVFFSMGVAFQKQNQHSSAMEVFQIAGQLPELQRDKTFRKHVKLSAKFAPSIQVPLSSMPFYQSVWFWGIVIILAALGLVVLIAMVS